MAPSNTFEITVLEDGSVRIVTESFSEAIHTTAEDFLTTIEKLMGNQAEKEPNRRKAAQTTHRTSEQVKGHQK